MGVIAGVARRVRVGVTETQTRMARTSSTALRPRPRPLHSAARTTTAPSGRPSITSALRPCWREEPCRRQDPKSVLLQCLPLPGPCGRIPGTCFEGPAGRGAGVTGVRRLQGVLGQQAPFPVSVNASGFWLVAQAAQAHRGTHVPTVPALQRAACHRPRLTLPLCSASARASPSQLC